MSQRMVAGYLRMGSALFGKSRRVSSPTAAGAVSSNGLPAMAETLGDEILPPHPPDLADGRLETLSSSATLGRSQSPGSMMDGSVSGSDGGDAAMSVEMVVTWSSSDREGGAGKGEPRNEAAVPRPGVRKVLPPRHPSSGSNRATGSRKRRGSGAGESPLGDRRAGVAASPFLDGQGREEEEKDTHESVVLLPQEAEEGRGGGGNAEEMGRKRGARRDGMPKAQGLTDVSRYDGVGDGCRDGEGDDEGDGGGERASLGGSGHGVDDGRHDR